MGFKNSARWLGASAALLLAACGDGKQDTSGDADSGAAAGSAGASGATAGSAGKAGDAGTGGATGGSAGTGGTTGGSAGTAGSAGSGVTLDILKQIEAIPGVVTVTEEPSEIDGYRYFLIDFDQPVDHDNPDGQHFTQRLALHHRDSTAPFVLAATGYYLFLPYQYLEEPSELLEANQLFVEQRYFSPSRPDPADWALLNVKQAAADHHKIVEAFKPIYSAKWISTGVSKGGMTSVYHHRFYPSDVDGTVAYVAPHSAGLDDPRYIDFLNNVGTAACRQKLVDFEREVLKRRSAMEARMQDQATMYGLAYNLIGLDPSFEVTVTDFTFAFWQYQKASQCNNIPDVGASDDEVWQFFDEVGLTLYSTDPYLLDFEPYYWQAATELGDPGADNSALADLLQVDIDKIDVLPSVDIDPVFDPNAMKDISTWLTTQGSHILFIYGQNDPWSAAQFELGGATDSYKFIAPGGNHGSEIADLVPGDKKVALDALGVWAGVMPKPAPPAPHARPMPPPFRKIRRLHH